jgi:predicted PurR-regulated permease PerM
MEHGSGRFTGVIALMLGIAALHFGRPLLMPLALAMLVSFCLAPLVDRLERPLGRVAAVIATCVLIGALLGGVGTFVAREASGLASSYPQYRDNLRVKIKELRGPIGSLSGAAEEFNRLGEEIDQKEADRPAAKVEVVERPRVLGTIGELLKPLLEPIGTAALVAVLALFMLLEREELRDRLIWLTGSQHLSLTTHAVDDAAQRVSRYLGTQAILCGLHGSLVAVGLLWIGVPGAIFWGALAALLRFLPYFGPWIAALLPIAVAVAAFPGWQPALATAVYLAVLELIQNNVLEPRLYGASVGLSPFAVIFSTIFWTWLWGIPGLLLATPFTVCLVVAGRYIRGLEYLTVLLGDRPALSPEVRLYQRLLALDLDEAASVLRETAADSKLEDASDRLVLPVLRRLAEDDQQDALPEDRSRELRERFAELLEEFAAERAEPAPRLSEPRVLFVPALDETEQLAGRWLARVVGARGVPSEVASTHELTSELVDRAEAEADLVCISALTPRAVAHARHVCKRLRAASSDCEVVMGLWAAPPHESGDRSRTDGAPRVRWVTRAEELTAAVESARARAGALRPELGAELDPVGARAG